MPHSFRRDDRDLDPLAELQGVGGVEGNLHGQDPRIDGAAWVFGTEASGDHGVGHFLDTAGPDRLIVAFGRDGHRRSQVNLRRVVFVNLGLDSQAPQVGDLDNLITRGHGLAGIDVSRGDHAVDRSHDPGLGDPGIEPLASRDRRGASGAGRVETASVNIDILGRTRLAGQERLVAAESRSK